MERDSIMVVHPDDQSRQTADIMRRFNDVFQLHDPSALAELVAEDCVIENTVPAPDGARHAGREACVRLWSANPAPASTLKKRSSPVSGRQSAGATGPPKATPSVASI